MVMDIEEEIACEGFGTAFLPPLVEIISSSTERIIIAIRTMLNFFLLCGYYCSYYSCRLAGDESETWIK